MWGKHAKYRSQSTPVNSPVSSEMFVTAVTVIWYVYALKKKKEAFFFYMASTKICSFWIAHIYISHIFLKF